MKIIEKEIKGKYVSIEYDEEKYDVEIIYSQMYAVLKSKTENGERINHIFDLTKEHIIKQIGNQNAFYTIIDNGRSGDTFTFYSDWEHELYERQVVENVIYITSIKDGVFMLYLDDNTAVIYNTITHRMSNTWPVSNIDINPKVMDYIDPRYHSTVLIRETVEKGIAKDTITYGLDIDKMDLATKIWSVEQQRYVKKYNKRETAKCIKKITRFVYKDTVEEKRGEATMMFEIDKYLELLNEQGIYNVYPNQDKDIMVYDDEKGHIPNVEHLKHLKRRYYVGKQKKSNIN